MFCKNCGKEIDNKSKFCQFCGCKLISEDYNTNLLSTTEETINQIENSSNNNEQVTFIMNEYKSKWVTLLLYFFPFFGWFGLYNLYAKRKKGIFQISLWGCMWLSIIIGVFSGYDITNSIIFDIFAFLVLILWISDIVWVFKLPRKYYIKNNIVYK